MVALLLACFGVEAQPVMMTVATKSITARKFFALFFIEQFNMFPGLFAQYQEQKPYSAHHCDMFCLYYTIAGHIVNSSKKLYFEL